MHYYDIGGEWKGMSATQRHKYDAMAARDKLRYENEKTNKV